MLWGNSALRARGARRPPAAMSVRKLTTWPRACTPASVRPLASVAGRVAGDLFDRFFERRLHRGPLRLRLPAGEVGAVIGQGQLDASASSVCTSNSAICTALVAAPLRRLSLTHQKARPLGEERSSRIRPMNVSSRSFAMDRHGIDLLLQVVDHDQSRRGREQPPGLVDADLPLGLHQDALAVAVGHRHADAGRADLDRVVFQHLARLQHHLHLFRRVALVLGRADLRNAVEGDADGRKPRTCTPGRPARRGCRRRGRGCRQSPAPLVAWYVLTITRRTRPASCSGFSAWTICVVEQLGLEMIPWCRGPRAGLTSGITSGTLGSIRQ